MQEQRRLKEEEKQATILLQEYQRKASEALARLSRVREQREFLVEKGADMVARGLSTLDELEEAERRDSAAALVRPFDGSLEVTDWDAVLASVPELAALGDPGSSDEIPAASQGSGVLKLPVLDPRVQDLLDVPFFFFVFCLDVVREPYVFWCWFE
ncbi:hypothetical protein P885DRAFT_82392 [Corynascus similis CBS 632.67]